MRTFRLACVVLTLLVGTHCMAGQSEQQLRKESAKTVVLR